MDRSNLNKNKIIIINLVILFAIIIVSIVLVLYSKTKKIKDERTINFYHFSNIYSFVETNNYFKMLTKQVIYCFKAPCNPYIIDVKDITNKEEIKNLTSIFNEMFKNTNKSQVTVSKKELTEEEIEKLLNIVENNIQLKYNILNNFDTNNARYSKRGYLLKKFRDDSVIITIAMGAKNSGGYSIEIKNVKIQKKDVYIIVTENSPGQGQTVTMDLTYPYVQIRFNRCPKILIIMNDETKEIFREIKI